MAIAGSAAPSIHVMLQSGRLIEQECMYRQWSTLTDNPRDAWAKLLVSGECYLWLNSSNLPDLRILYAAWVFERGGVAVGKD
jgi:hypothetical protein